MDTKSKNELLSEEALKEARAHLKAALLVGSKAQSAIVKAHEAVGYKLSMLARAQGVKLLSYNMAVKYLDKGYVIKRSVWYSGYLTRATVLMVNGEKKDIVMYVHTLSNIMHTSTNQFDTEQATEDSYHALYDDWIVIKKKDV